MRILSVLIVMLLFNSVSFAEEQTSQSMKDYRVYLSEEFNKVGDEISAELIKAKDIASRIAEYYKKEGNAQSRYEEVEKKYKIGNIKTTNALNQWGETSKKLSAEYADVTKSIIFYEIHKILYKDKTSQKNINKATIITAINRAQKEFNIRADTCMNDTTYIKSPVCDDYKDFCRKDRLYGVENYRLYFDRVTANYEIERVFIDRVYEDSRGSSDEFQKFPKVYQFHALFCGLLSTTTITMSPADITAWGVDNEIRKLMPFVYTDEDFKNDCISKKPPATLVSNMLALLSRYPENSLLKMDEDRYNMWIKNCNETVRIYCTNTYVIRNTVVLSYPTVGCEMRDVTETDIQRDMQLFLTDAEKLNHSTLLDTIDLCQKAYEDGYRWDYINPQPHQAAKRPNGRNRKASVSPLRLGACFNLKLTPERCGRTPAILGRCFCLVGLRFILLPRVKG